MLTDAKIRGLQGEANLRREYRDELAPGLLLRVSTKSKVWIVRKRVGSQVITATLGHYGQGNGELTLAAARARAVDIDFNARSGVAPTRASPRKALRVGTRETTVDLFVETFMTGYVVDRMVKLPHAYRGMFKRYILPAFGAWSMRAITRRDCKEWLRQIHDTYGTTTARRVGGLFRRFLNYAAEEEVIDFSPMIHVRLPSRENHRERILGEVEIRAFWRATDPASNPQELNRAGRPASHPADYPWGAYFRLLMLTGQRRGEIAAMRWASIDLAAGTWALGASETKAKPAHLLPLTLPAIALLRGMPRLSWTADDGRIRPSPWVLTTNGAAHVQTYSKAKAWLDAAMLEHLREEDSDAELPPWVVHDIRRTVSTNLARLGVEPYVRRRVLNHAVEGLDRIYDQFDYLEPKRKALDLWAKDLARITDSHPPTDNVIPIRGRQVA